MVNKKSNKSIKAISKQICTQQCNKKAIYWVGMSMQIPPSLCVWVWEAFQRYLLKVSIDIECFRDIYAYNQHMSIKYLSYQFFGDDGSLCEQNILYITASYAYHTYADRLHPLIAIISIIFKIYLLLYISSLRFWQKYNTDLISQRFYCF